MAKVIPGRYTGHTEDRFVVFLIGMRVNRLWAVHKWLPTALAMGPMLQTLYAHMQDKGFLGARTTLFWRGVETVQYWRSFEELEHFARSQDDPHLKAWQRFNKQIGGDGSVGIFHETYVIQPGQSESIYVNMPKFGLADAFTHTPAVGGRYAARGRMRASQQPQPEEQQGEQTVGANASAD